MDQREVWMVVTLSCQRLWSEFDDGVLTELLGDFFAGKVSSGGLLHDWMLGWGNEAGSGSVGSSWGEEAFE